MSLAMSTDAPHVIGEAEPQQQDHATLETKPSVHGYTGGGYEHWRSYEFRPETPTRGKEDVYVSVHRLTAVVASYPADQPIEAVLDDLREKDVHHRSGVPWDNRPENLEAVPHGRHSEITQTQRRAWAEDAKREVEEKERQPVAADECAYCGEVADVLAECDAWPGEERCLGCAKDTANGHEVRL